MPATDRRFFQAAFGLPLQTYAGRGLEKAILRRRCPDLASLPVDTNSFRFEPLDAAPGHAVGRALEKLGRQLRRAAQPFFRGSDPRRYERVFNVDEPRWQQVRMAAEPLRTRLEAVLDADTVATVLPPAHRRLHSRTPLAIGSPIRLLAGLAFLLEEQGGMTKGLAVRGEPTSVAILTARCPPDLRTIVEKCLRPDPVQRYRAAGDLADDLERFLNGLPVLARPLSRVERIVKWTKRQPLAAASLAMAAVATLLGLGGTAYQLASLRKANTEITRSRDAADDANAVARRSLARLTDAAVRRLMVRGEPLNDEDRSFLRMVRDDYVSWPLEPDPRTNLRFRADGLTQLAMLLLEIDQYGEALAAQQPLIATLKQLESLGRDPSEAPPPPSLERLGAMRTERLIISRMSGPAAAEAAARRALALIDAVPDRDLSYRREHAAVLFELGWHCAALDRDDEAVTVLDRGLAVLRDIRADAPDDLEAMRLEVAGLFNTGLVHHKAGRDDDQAALMRRLVDSTSATLKRSVDSPLDLPIDVPKGLSMGLAFLAGRETAKQRWPEAIALMQRRLDVCREWLDRKPLDSVMRGQTIEAGIELASGYAMTGEADKQDEAMSAAVALAEAGVAAEPAVYDACLMLARAQLAAAGLVVDGKQHEMIGMLERGLEIMTPWQNIEGRQQEVKNMLVEIHVALAGLFAAVGDNAGQVSHLEAAEPLVPKEHLDRLQAMIAAARTQADAPPDDESSAPGGRRSTEPSREQP